MGRVTDAFRRASEDRLPTKPEFDATDKDLIAQFSDQTWVSSLNGHQPKQTKDTGTLIIGAAEDPSNPSKQSARVRTGPEEEEGLKSIPKSGRVKSRRRTFGNWLEKCLLGRDTAALSAHSLIALEEYSPAGEQYKILREQIKKLTSERGARVLAVTSPLKGDGKSTVAANLAASIALDYEQQVLVIDGDLRSPSLHQFFGVKSTPGLAEYLSSDSGPDGMSYIQKTSISGLRIFTAGKSSMHSSELLAKERMKALIREIHAGLPDHLIIVDTSPILSTPDPFVIAQQVDGILMVIRAGKTPRACLAEAIKSLGSNKVMGVILNGAELGTASRYYYSAPSQSPASKLD